ncbi:MAG: UDP-N-acetylmuramate--L-alanine ligase, partial [Nitrospiria bacterium]
KNFDSNHHLGKGDYFVVEGDEYNTAFFDKGPKFLHYRPDHAILTSIEFDHADIFPDLSTIQGIFQKFVQLIPPNGRLLASSGSIEIDHLISELHSRPGTTCHIERYGTDLDDDSDNHQNDWQATSVQIEGPLTHFDVIYRQRKIGEISSPLIGRHNLKNSLAVIALCYHLGLSWQEIQSGIRTFQGVKRRQEIIGCVRDIIVMDDFAHHPTAIAETLAGLRLRYPQRRLWVVFEPRSATSRRNHFQDAFVSAFQIADQTVLTDIHAPEKILSNLRLNPQKIIADLLSLGKRALFIPSPDQVVNILYPQLQEGDLVCIMSSGGFGGIHKKLLGRLRATLPNTPSFTS